MASDLAALLSPPATGNALADSMIGRLQDDVARGYLRRPEYLAALGYGLMDYVFECRNALQQFPDPSALGTDVLTKKAHRLTDILLSRGANSRGLSSRFQFDLSSVATQDPFLAKEMLTNKDGAALDVLGTYAQKLFVFDPKTKSPWRIPEPPPLSRLPWQNGRSFL